MIVSAFEPFGNDRWNRSLLVLNELPDELQGECIDKVVLPMRASAADTLAHCIVARRARMVVMLGQASGRDRITVERIAINCDDYGIADCDGVIVWDSKIAEDGADGLSTLFPYAEIIKDVQKTGIGIAMSNTAGTYICNPPHVSKLCSGVYPCPLSGVPRESAVCRKTGSRGCYCPGGVCDNEKGWVNPAFYAPGEMMALIVSISLDDVERIACKESFSSSSSLEEDHVAM